MLHLNRFILTARHVHCHNLSHGQQPFHYIKKAAALMRFFCKLFYQTGSYTLLGKAAAEGKADIVEQLLAAGAAIDGKDDKVTSP